MILHDKKLIFFHIPRTGGTSMAYFLIGQKAKSPHKLSFQQRKLVIDGKYGDYVKFCTVRDPLERLVSIYKCYREGGNKTDGDKRVQEYVNELGFDKFMSMASDAAGLQELKDRFFQFSVMLVQQREWVLNGESSVVDFCVALEDLNDFFLWLNKRYAMSKPLERRNKTEGQFVVSSDVKKAVYDLYADDLRIHQQALLLKKWQGFQ